MAGYSAMSQASGWFTLTNGSLWFFEGGANDTTADGKSDPQYLYRTGFDESSGYSVSVNTLGTHAINSATHTMSQGDYYLKLDISDANNPRVVAASTSSFDPLCLWYRTGYTGMYYQTWPSSDGKSYEYYLVANSSRGVWVYKHEVGTPMETSSLWSNWDFGAAITESGWRNGQQEEEYYWMILKDRNDLPDPSSVDYGGPIIPPVLALSVNTYQRPDAEKYYNFRSDNGVTNTWTGYPNITYYDNVSIGGSLGGNYPRGAAITYMPVQVIDHAMVLPSFKYGTGKYQVVPSSPELTINETIDIGAIVKTTDGGTCPTNHEDPYIEYIEETYRRGINLNYRNRNSEGWNQNGIAQTRTWYYYDNNIYNTPPNSNIAEETYEIDSVRISIDPVGSRYLKVEAQPTDSPDIEQDELVEMTYCWGSGDDDCYSWYDYLYRRTFTGSITCYDIPLSPTTATITATIYYTDVFDPDKHLTETMTTTVTVKYQRHADSEVASRRAPAIKGSVFGGGKMANVMGDSKVTVHSADTIYAVYGGNDIAGWVEGENGATVQVGTTQTSEEHPIHIGWVYGGGCGYYSYQEVYDTETGSFGDTLVNDGLGSSQLVFRGDVYPWHTRTADLTGDDPVSPVATGFTYDPTLPNAMMDGTGGNGTIPYVKKTSVTIGEPEVNEHYDAKGHDAHEHNDFIFIDSVFGGAENAFVGVLGTNAPFPQSVDVDIWGGTIMAVFGGNNYGGALADKSLVNLTVNCTKLVDEADMVDNTYFRGYGKDYGIRHLFGGGNMVHSTHAEVTFAGGMVDTAFIGGNSATVDHPIGIVECLRSSSNPPQLRNGHNGHFIYSNPYMTDTTNNGAAYQTPGLKPNMGQYNVRFLFGGNNLADMNNASFLQLHSGGVCSVYGGGNKGNMNNDRLLSEDVLFHQGYIDIAGLFSSIRTSLDNSRLIDVPKRVGAIVAANEESQIIADYIHGGCRNANVKSTCGVYLAGGNYYDVWAGNDVSGDIGSESDGASYAVITGDAVVQNNVYGASDGYYHCSDANGRYVEEKMMMDQFNPDEDYDPFNDFVGLLLPTQQNANVLMTGGLIKGDLVAGGVSADVGFSEDRAPRIRISSTDTTTTKLNVESMKGTVRLELAGDAEVWGNVFGGGAYASIHGLSQVLVYETPVVLGGLFAGNDCTGKVRSFLPYQSKVDYSGCVTHDDSLAAERANQAAMIASDGTTHLNLLQNDGTYNPAYHSYVLIEDTPIINSVYGSGNGAWDYDGTRPQFKPTYVCTGMNIADNRPSQYSTFIDINTSGGFIDTVFGGGAGSTVDNSVLILVNNTEKDNSHYPDLTDVQAKSRRLGRQFIGGTTRSELAGTNFVGTIFGGNNFDPMSTCVPDIQLLKGNVKNVYGGANAGDMNGLRTFTDANGEEVPNVSAHVIVESRNMTVTDTLFGGCRMSNISGITFVEVRETSDDGVNYVYGGNDISGNVDNTRVDISGGVVNRIWGGSNGRYDFVPVGEGLYNVYPWGGYNASDPNRNLLVTAGRPDVVTARVNLWGGTINSSVFTGGSMADCSETFLVVDDRKGGANEVTVNGSLYGGGEGRWDNLHARNIEGNRWGNVNGSTHVDLYHAKNVTSAMAYGGGGGGDVNNTYITSYPTWDSKFLKIFGGCWGSDVRGTTHITLNGKELVSELFGGNDFAGYVYSTEVVVNSGKFDFIYGGGNGEYPDSYYHTQYDYPLLSTYYGYMNALPDIYKDGDSLTHPNTEYVRININAKKDDDVHVRGNVYGGGKVGTVLPLKKDNMGYYEYVNDDGKHRIPDTARTLAMTVSDPREFSYIATNIHGGTFHNDIFGGGRGPSSSMIADARMTAIEAAREANPSITDDEANAVGNEAVSALKKPLVYGLKVVNMDGGNIYHSLYGGSEYVHDGYPAECKVPAGSNPTLDQRLAVTTMRPSSIVNVAGGQVGYNLYGAGYMGNVYGSVFVNVGLKAIDSCTVWKHSYGTDTEDSTYFVFKPGYPAKSSASAPSDKLKATELMLNESVFSGSNWGEGSGATELNVQGFFGGESRLIVDGEGYNTGNSDVATEPSMNIARSLLGSGTSVNGGDIHSQVELRNYGQTDACGTPIKTLEAIQRADSLWMHNSVVKLTGATDASSVYQSNKYTINLIDDVCYRGYNVTEFDAPIHEVGSMAFYEQTSESDHHTGSEFLRDPSNTSDPYKYLEVPILEHNEILPTYGNCSSIATICDKTNTVNPKDAPRRHSLLILNNGIDFPVKMNGSYGEVKGFAFITSPEGFSSLVSARNKILTSATTGTNVEDGGFSAVCIDSNMTRGFSGSLTDANPISPDWTHTGTVATDEFPYTNHGAYRVWRVGRGLREREVTLLAHINPNKLDSDQPVTIVTSNGSHDLAIAEASFELPSTQAGHYYTLRWQEGIDMEASNAMLYLVDSAWSPTLGMQSNTSVNMATRLTNAAATADGTWKLPVGATDKNGVTKIEKLPESTFGLVMVPDKNFQLTTSGVYDPPFDMPDTTDDGVSNPVGQDEANLVISGNQRVNSGYKYCSPKVYHDPNDDLVTPSMRFYLTYSPTFMTTLNGTVTFYLNEYDAAGNDMGPVRVKVNIQTIIDSLVDMEQNVMAMYNGGRTNEYTRKVVFPGLGEERQLYIDGIRWLPTNGNGEDLSKSVTTSAFSSSDQFSLLGDTNSITATDIAGYPHDLPPSTIHSDHSSHNRFGLTIMTTNNVSESSTQANGWGGSLDTINLYELRYPEADGKTPVKYMGGEWTTTTTPPTTDSLGFYSLVNVDNPKGRKLGTLDGRGSAGLDVKLNFDGTRMYDQVDGKGYVGRYELHMKSYYEYDGSDSVRDDFVLTIYVKTRDNGDTIYVASADHVTRQIAPNKSVTLYPYTDLAHHPGISDSTALVGKVPSLYVQSLVKALDNDIYQEGDVIAIIDTVNVVGVVQITGNKTQHIVGPMGPPIEVMRYDGHHHDLPDEQGVYRGPMIRVYDDGLFTAQNIYFNGGVGTRIKKVQRATPGDDASNAVLTGDNKLQFVTSSYNYTINSDNYTYVADKYPDTNRAFGPILEVTDGGEAHLLDGTVVQHNWNVYGSRTGDLLSSGSGLTKHPELMGVISITDGGHLKVKGNVEVKNNFVHTITGFDTLNPIPSSWTWADSVSVRQAPGNGNVYIAGGTLELAEARHETAVKVVNNYLMNTHIHDNPIPDDIIWFETENMMLGSTAIPERYVLKPEKIANWHKANVYLTRTPKSGAVNPYQNMMYDDTTDVVIVSGSLGDETQLGVRKWFPGYDIRDTIRIARATGGNTKVLEIAVGNGAFVADDDFRVFYNSAVNNAQAYFFRCASFRHQDGSGYVDPVFEYADANTEAHSMLLAANNVLKFGASKELCPTGGDAIIYSVQGGFMPYTYTWTDPSGKEVYSEKITPYKNTQVQYDLAGGENATSVTGDDRFAKYAASMTDTLMVPYEEMTIDDNSKWKHILVSAIDATGECEVHKYIDLRVKMTDDVVSGQQVTYMDDNTKTDNTTYATPDTALAAVVTPVVSGHANWKTEVANGWTDTASDVKAIASRNFSGVKVTPRIWVDRTVGTILAAVPGDDYIYQYVDESETHELENLRFCPGDVIYLKAVEEASSNKFIMWDFDPYYRPLVPYVVPRESSTVTAYYGPYVYWYQHINSTTLAGAVYDNSFSYTERPAVAGYTSTDGTGNKAGFVNTYNGDIHIYDENGLAWLISRVNGLNGQQSRTFRFNRVLIHKKADGTAYDMRAHLWTPVGAEQHPFMGRMFGVDTDETADLPWSGIDSTMNEGVMTYDTHWYEPVVIKNIIVNEPQMYSTGLFGHMDSAGVYNIALHGELIRGSQYVGGIAGTSAHSYVRRSQVKSDIEDSDLDTGFAKNEVPTTILTTHYVSGGMLGKSTLDTVRASEVAAKFVGDAVYSGGGIGYGTGSIIRDVKGWNFNRLQGLYLGGMAGYLDGVAPVTPTGIGRLFGRKSPGVPSRVENNYFHIASDGGSQRLGGIVGYAENTIIENNYVYGELNASNVGGVAAVAGDGTEADHNYYQKGSATNATYRTQGNAAMGQSSTFEGEGNDVQISDVAYGTTNLTHALNKWVREHNANGDNFLTWRSANEGENSGYPVFGLPGVIHVVGRDTVEGCGEVFYNGITYFQSTTLSFDVENPDEMVDSSVTVQIIVHNEARTTLRDSADVYEGYQGYGFTVTPTEAALLLATIQAEGSARLVLTDTLQTQYGCDSIVTLLLIFTGTTQDIEEIELIPVDLKVYPNPTQDKVTVETIGMSRVELYDNEGRRLEDYTVDGDIFRISLVHLPSGMYYLRVHTPRGVTIQKVVKR